VNKINGIQAKNYILRTLEEFPEMKIIIKLIKYILRINCLNETHSGGVGSFLIFNLVYAYFLYLKRISNGKNWFKILVGFLFFITLEKFF